ncbi:MAG: chemotaxis protein CheB [Myxococcaceae bacterium]
MAKKPTKKPSAAKKKQKPEPTPTTRTAAPALPALSELNVSRPAPPAVPIVGIGASAGGLEALEAFLRNVPAGCGLAFVVVQHLDPDHKGALVELLQRSTSMPVTQAVDRIKAEPEHVYVIPPGNDMSLLHGVLHLLPQAQPRGLNLPIDFFFRSLAEDQQEHSIGVILSGMGSDGLLGLRAIKEKAGATFVQDVRSAQFSGMPRSVIDAGLADVVDKAEELPKKIIAYRQHLPGMAKSDGSAEDRAQSALEKVFVLLRAHTGNDFSLYKQSTIYRRIERRMGLHQLDLDRYVRLLRENPREIELLFKELLIGVTSFFRDPAAWESLKKDVLPALIAARQTGGQLRAWVPGCSTGEEAYSLAMAFKEAMEPLKPVKNLSLQIFATDLDSDAINFARQALYPDNIAADVSPERLRRYFVKEERGYRVGKEIREMVVFAPQNVIMAPPFTKLDFLSCRNLLIYLSNELQRKLIPLFHYSLNPGGVLFLGSAETIGAISGLFQPLDAKSRIYKRLDQIVSNVPLEFPVATFPAGKVSADQPEDQPRPVKAAPPNIQVLADRLIVQRFSPLGVLCNDKGDVLYVSGRSGRFLEPAVGKANLNIFAMAREGLRYEVSSAFSTTLRQDRPVTVRNLKVGTNGGTQLVDLMVEKLNEPKELRGSVLVLLTDAPEGRAPEAPKRHLKLPSQPARIAELERELTHAREEVQTTREEMQTSQEELKSTNEELQSTNEELQSSNEELTTSKEEMQSLNEELQTVNHELQAKVDELSRSNNDMKNLLNSTDIATLFLDANLNVRRFTTPTTRIIKLIPADAGRQITDIVSNLEYENLAEDATEVLRTLVFREQLVSTKDGRWYSMRIMPYRTLENLIDGVVITFSEMTAARKLEDALKEQASQAIQMAESLPTLVWGSRADGSCDYLSKQWVAYTDISEKEQLGYGWLDQVHSQDRDRVREGWRAAVKSGATFDPQLRLRRGDGAWRWFKTRWAPIRDAGGNITRWYGTFTDVDDLKHGEERLTQLFENISDPFVAIDRSLSVTQINHAAEKLIERGRNDVLGKKLNEAIPQLRDLINEAQLKDAVTKGGVSIDATLGPAASRYRLQLFPGSSDGVSIIMHRV